MAILEATGATKRFGGLVAVNNLDFSMNAGSIVSVIGPNGAGKTTFFNCIAGFYRIDDGSITFDGAPIHQLAPDRIAQRGISRTYQNIRLFGSMTALENVLVGMHHHMQSTWFAAVLRTPGTMREEREAEGEARRLLRFVGLQGKGDFQANKLAYGDQRRLEVARALANKPRLLLADEPTGNLDPATSTAVFDSLYALARSQGVAALVATHNFQLAAHMDRVFALKDGHLEPWPPEAALA